MVSQSTTYIELLEKTSQVIDIDTLEFEITMKFKLKTYDPIPLVAIKTNDDVKLFLKEIACKMKLRPALH